MARVWSYDPLSVLVWTDVGPVAFSHSELKLTMKHRFGSYEVMMRSFRAVPESSPYKVSAGTATFLAGGMSSNLFWIGSFPFDAVKK
jgi:hypothetical protein